MYTVNGLSLSVQFDSAKNIHALATYWLKALDAELTEKGVSTTVKTGAAGAVSLIAPAALLATVVKRHYGSDVPADIAVLMLGTDPMTLMDDGRWLNYAAQMAGITGNLTIGLQPSEPLHSSLQQAAVDLGLAPASRVTPEQAQDRLWDLVLWVHPGIESGECDAELEAALTLYAQGQPVYAVMYNELDAIVQSYGVAEEGLEFGWLNGSISIDNLSSESTNRLGVSTQQLGMEGGWGAVLTRLAPAGLVTEPKDWELIRLAMRVRKLQGDDDSTWRFGEALAGVAFNRYLPIALIGNMAVDQNTGVVLAQCPFTEVLKIIGHLCEGAVAEFPRTHFQLAPWAAKIKLLYTTRLTREDKKRDEILSLLRDAFEGGLVEAGVALARSLESQSKTDAAQQGLAVYEEIGTAHYLSAYALAHHHLAASNLSEALAYLQLSSDAGYPPAMTDYGALLLESDMVLQGSSLLRRSSQLGDKEAAFYLGEVALQSGNHAEAMVRLRDAWLAGHEKAHDVAIWLCQQMLEHGIGKRSAVKRELKEVTASKQKRQRLQEKLLRETA